jgi:hypothetical protein
VLAGARHQRAAVAQESLAAPDSQRDEGRGRSVGVDGAGVVRETGADDGDAL